jgi:hypothetical protein
MCLSDYAAKTIESIAGANAALQSAAQQATALLKNVRPPLQPSDVMAVQWKNDGDGGSLAAIKAIDDNDEIVFAADGTPALEIESPGRDVERVDVGDYVVRRVVGGLTAMKREVFEQTQRQIAEMGEPIGRLVYEDGSPMSKPEPEAQKRPVVHRQGDLLYTLISDGWRGRVEQFRNRLMVRIERDKSVPDAEYEALFVRLTKAIEYVDDGER